LQCGGYSSCAYLPRQSSCLCRLSKANWQFRNFSKAYVYTPVDQLLDTVSAGMAQAERLTDGTISISQTDDDSSRAFYANGHLTRNAALVKARPEKFREPNPKALTNAMKTAVINGPRDY